MTSVASVTIKAESRLREKLKNLAPSTKNFQQVAGEIKRVQTPELRSAMLDFILFSPSSSNLSGRIAIIAEKNPGGEIFSDDHFLDKLLGRLDPDGENEGEYFFRGDDAMALATLMEKGVRIFSPVALAKVMGVVIKLFPSRLFESGHHGADARNAFPMVLSALESMKREERERFLSPLVDAVLPEFKEFVRDELSARQITGKMWSRSPLKRFEVKSIISVIWTMLGLCSEKDSPDKFIDVIIEEESPALMLSGLICEGWPFGEDKTREIVTMALSRWGEKGAPLAPEYEYLYPELYFKAPPGELRERCLDRTISYARRSGHIRGLILLGESLLSETVEMTRDLGRDLERVLDGLMAVLEDSKYLTGAEWEQKSGAPGQQEKDKKTYREFSDYDIFISPWHTPYIALQTFGAIIQRREPEWLAQEKGSLIFASSAVIEKIFKTLLDCFPFSSSPSDLSSPFNKNNFDDFAEVFLRDDKTLDRFVREVEKNKAANVSANVINYMAKGLAKLSERRYADQDQEALFLSIQGGGLKKIEPLVAILVEEAVKLSSEDLGDTGALKKWGLAKKSVEQLAPLFAREFSRVPPAMVAGVYPVLFNADVPASLVPGLLLFSGELSGEAFDFFRGKFNKSLNSMINAFLGEREPLPDWFSGETFMRECVRFSDKPRRFSLNKTATQRFLDIAVNHLQDNPGDAYSTGLVAEFMSRCGGGVVKDIRSPGENSKLTQGERKEIEESLSTLESLLGNRLAELAPEGDARAMEVSL